MDFDASKINLIDTVICILFYTVVVAFSWKDSTTFRYNRVTKSKWLYLSIVIYCLFAILDGDYLHYWLIVHYKDQGDLEDIYQYYVTSISSNYLLFRLCVWGLATLCYYWGAKTLNLNLNRAAFILLTLYIGLFSYARASLAMAIVFLGAAILFTSSKNKLRILLGITIILSSTFFHRSIIAASLCIFLAYFFKFNKRLVIVVFCCLPIFIIYFEAIFMAILSSGIIQDQASLTKIVGYANSVEEEANFMGLIQKYMKLTIFYIPFLILLINIIFKKNNYLLPDGIRRMFTVAIIILLIAFCLDLLGPITRVMSYRIRYMAFIPICYSLCYCVDVGIVRLKSFRFCVILSLIGYYYYAAYSIFQFLK